MEESTKIKNPISLKILYWLTKLSYWGLILLFGIVTFAGSIMLTLDPKLMKLGFSSNITHLEEVTYFKEVTNDPVDVEVEFYAGSIEVPVKHLTRPTITLILLISLLFLACMVFIARCFKLFMRKVLDGHTFQLESIVLIKKAALGLLVYEVIDVIGGIIGYFYIQYNFDLGKLSSPYTLSFPSTAVIMALTLWCLAHIFQKGKLLEDEQKLTV